MRPGRPTANARSAAPPRCSTQELEKWRGRPLGQVKYLILDARYEKVRHGGSVVDVAVLSTMIQQWQERLARELPAASK